MLMRFSGTHLAGALLCLAGTVGCGSPTGPEPSPAAPGIVFLGSDPAPGSDVIAKYLDTFFAGMDLRARFSVRTGIEIPDALFFLEVFGEGGERCGYGFASLEPRRVSATETLNIEINGISWSCGFPGRTVSARLTVMSNRPNPQNPNGQMLRTEHLVRSFPLTYSYRRYPPAPQTAPPAPPAIASLTSVTHAGPCGGCGPLPGEAISVTCRVTAADGAPVTVTIAITFEGQQAQVKSETFPEGATSSAPGAIFVSGAIAPQPPPGSPYPRATATCVARNSRGETAEQTIQIPR